MFEYIQNNFQDFYYTSIYSVILLFLVIEHFSPRIKQSEPFHLRWINNIVLSIITLYSAAVLSFFYTPMLGFLSSSTPKVVLTTVNDSFILSFTLIFLVMEFTSYWMHRAFHHYQLLWRVHAVHHNDTEVDATTTHRHHPIEVLTSTVLLTPIYFLLQSPAEVYITYSVFRIFIATLSHSNLKLPEPVDNVLRLVIVTPDFHRLHHSDKRQYTDYNYGTITPWFDYLFGTATRIPYEEQSSFRTGLEYKRDIRDSRVDQLLLLPFVWLKKKAPKAIKTTNSSN